MKPSIRIIALLLGLLFAVSACSQDTGEDESGGTADTAATEPAEEATAEPDEDVIDDPAGDEAVEEAADEPDEVAMDEPASDEAANEAAPAESDMQPVAEPPAEAQSQADTPAPAEADPTTGQAELFMLQGHPIFTPEQAELVYRPLVNYLNEVLPYRFDLKIAPDFHRYWLGIRRGETPHLVLEEAHLTAFRITRDDYVPLVKAVEPTTYSLLTSVGDGESTVRDFIGRRVSSMPAPSLGYLVLTSWYENPMQQPIIQSNASSWLDAVEIVFSMEADAAIVPHNLVARYVNMENVNTSQEFPGVTISASPDVPESIQEEIRQALLVLHDDPDHFSAIHELDIDQFVEADPSEYEGLEEWLSLVYSIL